MPHNGPWPSPNVEIDDLMKAYVHSDNGRLVGYMGIVWIEGDGWEVQPGWSGPLKVWHARRYARRHGIVLQGRA